MSIPEKNRISSLDFLKGIVMVLMALDHTRDYFHADSFVFDPTDIEKSNLAMFFTRWVTHFCAPAFSMLAGVSAFIMGQKKTKAELSSFLLKRGLWLVFIEFTVVNFGWFFDIHFATIGLITIWSLGISMVVLSALVYLPIQVILAFSVILIFGHNFLDNIHFEGNIFWAILHEFYFYDFKNGYTFFVGYPLIPWIAVMSLGYCIGNLYEKNFDSNKRRLILNYIGISAIVLFFVLRITNIYGNPENWKVFDTLPKTIMSFFNVDKYPPSLSYLLITLGLPFLFLANAEKLKGKIVDFFSTFGRVPFFFYILHIYVIHFAAIFAAGFTGFGWQTMFLDGWVSSQDGLKGYGFSLSIVYLIWILIVFATYPLCKKFDVYKQNNREKWWLSYL
jgi:uncharacterized membrane protein